MKKKYNPILPFQALGWNSGQVDCGHYRSQLGFCITVTGDRSQPVVEVQALSRMGGIQGRSWATPKSFMPR